MYLIRIRDCYYCLTDEVMDKNSISREEFDQKAKEARI
jgi:hypothetical protein